MGKQGASIVEIACDIGVSRQTLYNWRDANPEFLDAITRAAEESQSWWERKGRDSLTTAKASNRPSGRVRWRPAAIPAGLARENRDRTQLQGRPGGHHRERRVKVASLAMATKPDPFLMLANDIGGFTHDPLAYAIYSFPWGSGPLADTNGPRAWQADVMEDIREHLSDPATRYTPLRLAVASGHGIGKSALIAMLAKWGLDTCDDCRIVMTANTEKQLLTKTMPEIAKWSKLAITSDWFRPTATALISTVKGHELSWRLDALPWSEHNTEAFAGLHNKRKRIIVILDEASKIAAKVWEVILGALTDEETEILFIAFGNPTQNTGAFRECFGKHRHSGKPARSTAARSTGRTRHIWTNSLRPTARTATS
jgi:hypothetical protein